MHVCDMIIGYRLQKQKAAAQAANDVDDIPTVDIDISVPLHVPGTHAQQLVAFTGFRLLGATRQHRPFLLASENFCRRQ